MNAIKTIDLSKTLKHYSNEGIALSEDQKKVLGRGKHPRDAYRQALLTGEKIQFYYGHLKISGPIFFKGVMQFPYEKYPADPNKAFPEKKSVLRPVIPVVLLV